MELGGLGTGDKGRYKPRALEGWKAVGYPGRYRWVGGAGDGRMDGKLVLPEEELGELEMELLRRSPEAVRFYMKDGGL